MRLTRIYTEQALTPGAIAQLSAPTSTHIIRVLRMTVGSTLSLFNGDGYDYQAMILAIGKHDVSLRIGPCHAPHNESPLRLTLAQCLIRSDKMDLVVQKATELGVTRVVPLYSSRSTLKLDASRVQKRLSHWRGVAISACEQSGRAKVPQLEPVQSLTTWSAARTDDTALRLVLTPAASTPIKTLPLPATASAIITIGPEGGFSNDELETMHQAGFHAVRLGPRILRTETAGLTTLAVLQALHGDLH